MSVVVSTTGNSSDMYSITSITPSNPIDASVSMLLSYSFNQLSTMAQQNCRLSFNIDCKPQSLAYNNDQTLLSIFLTIQFHVLIS